MTKLILDLCGGTGSWSSPYTDSGNYTVIVVDPMEWGSIPHSNALHIAEDVRQLTFGELEVLQAKYGQVQGVLAAPPCTVFANSGARWPRTEAEMLDGISIMDACLRVISLVKPRFWALENPIGKMKRYLGTPKMYFQPCDYGDPYTKKTCVWGDFTAPIKNPVVPTEGSKMHLNYGGRSAATKRARSATPQGFARAFYESNQ